ncbi:MAG: S-layer homology domain-containing protein, partial [Bacillota bacterium]|nr:S-layer homology domain-containing protein [Bacillota bacterium]
TDNTGRNTDNTGINTDNTGINTDYTGSNTDNTGSNTDNTGSNTDNTGSNTDNTGSNTDNTGSNTDNTGSNTDNTSDTDKTEDTTDKTNTTAKAIEYNGASDAAIAFNGSDFANACKAVSGSSFDYLKFSALPDSASGTLYYDYDGEDQAKVKTSNKCEKGDLSDISFVPKSDFTGTVTINYVAADEKGNEIKGSVVITIGSGSNVEAIPYTVYSESFLTFNPDDFDDVCNDTTDEKLSYVKFNLPSSDKGTLYSGYKKSGSYTSKISSSTKCYYTGSNLISGVSFVPNSSYTGTVTLTYIGYNTEGISYTGSIKIKVTDDEDEVNGDIDVLSYTIANNEELEFDSDEFNDICNDQKDTDLDYIIFTVPSTSYGTLYFGYKSSTQYDSKVTSSTKCYYDDDPDIADISFVPKSTYTGTVTFTYTAYKSSRSLYKGTVKIKVTEGEDDDRSADTCKDISCTVSNSDVLELDSAKIESVCKSATGYALDYVKFTLPSSSYGVLYLDYTSSSKYDSKVSKSVKYYYDDDPAISDVSFVPKTDYKGNMYITYTGYDVKGNDCTGKIKITVTEGDGEDDTEYDCDDIIYTLSNDDVLDFDSEDFQNGCEDVTDNDLNYVKFTLPASNYGVLYLNYKSSSGKYDSKVSNTVKYYCDDDPDISDISLVPKSGYAGTMYITYTGYDVEGNDYTGRIKIKVTSKDGDEKKDTDKSIKYITENTSFASFLSLDFSSICNDATSENLDYVKFTLPASSVGTLYYKYGEKDQAAITAAAKCYLYGQPELSNIDFVPASGYTGKVSINYVACNVEGDSYSGIVTITVNAGKNAVDTTPQQATPATPATPAAPESIVVPFSDVNSKDWFYKIVEKIYNSGLMKGNSNTTFNPSGNMTVAEAITMAVRLYNANSGGKDSDFTSTTPWYQTYIDYAIKYGIIKDGDFDNYTRTITRAEMAYIFFNCVPIDNLATINNVQWVPDVAKADKFGNQIYTLYNAGILTGSDASGTFYPNNKITRAEAATILARIAEIVDRVVK